ncbi:MAG: diguanylate cyclase [Herbinix sp.]|nr:diguanylate cyclase [Herbinix sp.]
MSGNILIVDDSPIDRKIIRSILEKRLHDIAIFETDGKDTDTLLKLNDISVCILDIVMPGKNGFEILNEIKKDNTLANIPVIICTSLNESQAIETALMLEAYDYFTKPLSEEAMKISLPLKVKNAIDLKQRSDVIIYLSYHDKLTGLYNRRYFEEELIQLNDPSYLPLSFVIGDVNGLKLANDAYGHEVGDNLLIKLSNILKEASRKNDIIFRTGGDEFVMILPNTTSTEAQHITETINKKCSNQPERPVKPSISLGHATKERLDQEMNIIYKLAEDRMYSNKLKESKNVKDSIILALRNTLKDLNHGLD